MKIIRKALQWLILHISQGEYVCCLHCHQIVHWTEADYWEWVPGHVCEECL